MWKYKPKFVNIVIVFFLTTLFPFNSFASVSIPEYIKIGLKYGNSAPSSVDLKSSSGFKIGLIMDEHIYDLIHINDNSIEIKNEQALYYIKIEDEFDTIEEALNLKNDLENEDLNTYIFYDGKFKIYLGSYLEEEECLEGKEELEESFSHYTFEIVSSDDNLIQILNEGGDTIFLYDSSEDIGIYSLEDNPISVDGKKYRGSIIFKRINNSNMTVINRLKLDEYLYGVVPKEMSGSWHIEALKAQAVAARNYAIMNMGKYKNYGFDLTNDTYSQVYGGYDAEHPNSNKAVDETKNKIMVYNGKIVDALYHSNSGGRTENSENIWSNKVPYLRGVEDSYSIGYPNDNWSVSFTKNDIQNKLSQNKVDIGELLDIKIEKLSENGRVLSLKFIGTEGEKEYTKSSARSILGLKSNWFEIVKEGDSNGGNSFFIYSSKGSEEIKDISNAKIITSDGIKDIDENTNIYLKGYNKIKEIIFSEQSVKRYILNGHGWGHGLGMSQWGAKKMAESGFSYEDILRHYYTGIEIQD
ncbi:SpoIID/LytB domain-containing protein [Tepidibacter formicigenes]|jgi:stage II sporulation protein D|uniref:Stage II sporulation protein D n=1 Tax=Tepidibacter formicigenes DSM 15518 TaxID=1123349 RepID=A0A1M6MWF7_9FIRM|nr:SpoIID/LytB domain-containing protein [Tepidibacter formicigenes]SHJ87815.1 stage II sporulation protein D [Tepidibacter formicigenes DSM 15518]